MARVVHAEDGLRLPQCLLHRRAGRGHRARLLGLELAQMPPQVLEVDRRLRPTPMRPCVATAAAGRRPQSKR
jgi:hypothetical protein